MDVAVGCYSTVDGLLRMRLN